MLGAWPFAFCVAKLEWEGGIKKFSGSDKDPERQDAVDQESK